MGRKKIYEDVKGYWVYSIKVPSVNKYYIGVSKRQCCQRWKKSMYKTTALNQYLDEWDSMVKTVLVDNLTREEALKYEDNIIRALSKNDLCINERRSGLIRVSDEKQYHKQWYEDNKEKVLEQQKQYYENNKEHKKQIHKQWYEDNKEKVLEQQKQYQLDNKEKIQEYHKQYYENNKEKAREYDRQWKNQRYENDSEYREKVNQRNKQYREKNKEKIREQQRQYRLKKKLEKQQNN